MAGASGSNRAVVGRVSTNGPFRPLVSAAAVGAFLISLAIPARIADAALVRNDGGSIQTAGLQIAVGELQRQEALIRSLAEKAEAARLEHRALTDDRKAVATGIGRMESLQAILARNLETLAVEQADQQTRLVDLDEALKAASVALVRQERQASAGDREERTLGLKAWIATLGARRKTARLRVDAIREETLELQARLAALGRSRTALGERLRDVEGELQSLSTLRDFRDRVRHQQEWRVRAAEEQVRNLQDQIAIAEAQAEEAADAPLDADGMSGERGGGEHRVGSVSEGREPLPEDRVASVRESGGTQNRSAGSSMQLDFLPLQGTILFDFGDQDGERKSNGITIAADAGAEIVAPVGGRVVFSGPFKDYGLLLIIDHGNEYHTLLTGFGDIGPREGDIVRAGQMVGRLAERLDSNSRLYLELRYRGMPVNPLPWLAARSDKVRG